MKIHQLSVEETLARLNSSPAGLARAEAERRLREFGKNSIEAARRTPLLLRLLREFVHFFALILWVAAALAFFAEWRMPGQGMGTLAIAIVCVILINGIFSFWQEYRAERTLEALRRLLPLRAKVWRQGRLEKLLAEELVPGDVIELDAGDAVPADARLIRAERLRLNVATLTGESVPRTATPEPSVAESLLDSRNVVLAGTSVVAGTGTAVVFATGMRTVFGAIARSTQQQRKAPSPLMGEIAHMSRLFAWLATGLGVAAFFAGRAAGMPLAADFMFAIGIIVANVPEGLLPTMTLALAMATQRMARRRALVRHLPAVEALGATTVIVTDKTGTLTENRMAVAEVFVAGHHLPAQGADLPAPLLDAAAHCHELHGQGPAADRLGDPMEVALAEFAAWHGIKARFPRLGLVPFDSERKRLSTLHATPEGAVLYCKGAPETVLPLCSRSWAGDRPRPLTAEERATLAATAAAIAERGLRVLAFAWRPPAPTADAEPDAAEAEADLVFLGFVALRDPPRPEVPAAIETCRRAGVRLIMVTGDHPRTALALAREIGLADEAPVRIITGPELERMTAAELQLALDAPQTLFARLGPDQKTRVVEALRHKGEVVAVTGDGVNDAPALRAADIGIAMGRSGTDVAREAADLILLDDNFATIVAAIEEGRAVYDNLRKFLTYILTSNIPEIVPYVAFALFAIPLPLTVMQILAVDLGTDLLPALALGAERPDAAVMRRPPRPRQARLMDLPLAARAYLWLGLLEAAAAMTAYFLVLTQHGWHYGDMPPATDPTYRLATTACLASIVVMQVVNVFLCRSPHRFLFDTTLGGNRLLLPALAVEIGLLLAIVYTAPGQAIFGTAALPLEFWPVAATMALAMAVLEEGRKAWVRRRAIPKAAGAG